MPVLQYLDVVLGMAVVMLILATAVAAASQTILTSALVRARHMVDGLDGLLERSLGADLSRGKLAELLSDPRIGEKSTLFSLVKLVNRRFSQFNLSPPEDLRREEFVLLLLEKLEGKALGFDPKTALSAIREHALSIEKQFPGLPAHEWRAKAILKVATESGTGLTEEARKKFAGLVGSIFSAFDNTMDRVADHTAKAGRLWAIAVAFPIVFGLGVDSIDLMKRLSMDGASREMLVEMARRGDLDAGAKKEAQRVLTTGRLDILPPDSDPRQPLRRPGVWITWVLVSLGAPFWQEMIRKLIGFRTLIGQKEEQARSVREASQTTAG